MKDIIYYENTYSYYKKWKGTKPKGIGFCNLCYLFELKND